MKNIDFTIILHCNICGIPIGSGGLSASNGWTEETATEANYLLKNGIVDNRCTADEAAHGSFKELVEDCRQVFKNGNTAEAFVKQHRKASVVSTELLKLPELAEGVYNFRDPTLKSEFDKLLVKRRAKI